MKMEAKCRFCGKSVSLEVDDAYASLGDPLKFMKKASCDRCAKFHEVKRAITDNIKTICEVMIQKPLSEHNADMARESLKGLCVRYLEVLAKHRGHTVPQWDENITEALMRKPRNFRDVIHTMGQMTRQETLL